MNLEQILKRKAEIRNSLQGNEEVDLEALEKELRDLTEKETEIRDKAVNAEKRKKLLEEASSINDGGSPETRTVETFNAQLEIREEKKVESEKRGKDLKENRSVTVGSSNIILPNHQGTDIRPTFNEISSLIDGVSTKNLIGGESYQQPYVVSYGEGGETGEGEDYTSAETKFDYADITKSKVTAYAEDTEELQKLPAADYDSEVMRGITIAARKRMSRQILVGDGATNNIVGIFSDKAKAIDPTTDLEISKIDKDTLDDIVFSFGGDEDVEDGAVLICHKLDLKAFAKLRSTDGKKLHNIVSNGNKGTIDGIPFLINSACKPISSATTTAGQFGMAYGPLSNYLFTIFSEMDVQRSTDYKFKQGMIAHKGVTFVGGNVVSKNGFLRVKKAEQV